jgi:hypothetical protein
VYADVGGRFHWSGEKEGVDAEPAGFDRSQLDDNSLYHENRS